MSWLQTSSSLNPSMGSRRRQGISLCNNSGAASGSLSLLNSGRDWVNSGQINNNTRTTSTSRFQSTGSHNLRTVSRRSSTQGGGLGNNSGAASGRLSLLNSGMDWVSSSRSNTGTGTGTTSTSRFQSRVFHNGNTGTPTRRLPDRSMSRTRNHILLNNSRGSS